MKKFYLIFVLMIIVVLSGILGGLTYSLLAPALLVEEEVNSSVIIIQDDQVTSAYGAFRYEILSDSSYGITCTQKYASGITRTIVYVETEIFFDPTQVQMQFRVRRLNSYDISQFRVIVYDQVEIYNGLPKLGAWINIPDVNRDAGSEPIATITHFRLYAQFSYSSPVGEQVVLDIRAVPK